MASHSKHKEKHSDTMEVVMNSINHACELARNLESKLPNMANQPDMLSSSIDGILKEFSVAKGMLLMMMQPQQDQAITASSFAPSLPHDATQQAQMGASSMQGWLHTMDQLYQMQQQPFDVRANLLESKMMGGVDLQQLRHALQIGGMSGVDVEGIEASPSRRRKSRKNDAEKKTVMFPAPQVGNTEMPPEDGFTWRKYGQKEILGKKYPRSYYRCTHQKLYACPAKKQVQRLDHDPTIFEVTYRGEHTCHMSSTAPSSFPPPQLLMDISQDMAQSTISPQLSQSSTSVPGWLSSVNLLQGSSSIAGASAGAAAGGSAGPSTSKYGTDYLVADMADAMFNSGSSSGNNSMEYLFPPTTEDKWEPSEKKS